MPGATLDATLTETPQGASDGSQFPSASTTIPFGLNTSPNAKPVQASTGRILRQINSPSAFVQLDGVGTGDAVTQASTVYLRVRTPAWQARITFNNPANVMSPIVSVLPIAGVLLLEPDYASGFFVTKVEIQGSGSVELYASGLM